MIHKIANCMYIGHDNKINSKCVYIGMICGIIFAIICEFVNYLFESEIQRKIMANSDYLSRIVINVLIGTGLHLSLTNINR